MHANVGDRLVIKGHHVGDPDRDAEILAVKGANGEPPEGEARALVIATGGSTRLTRLAEFVLYANGQEGT